VSDTKNVPLAVDLDGTLIRTDMMFESLARLLRRNPLSIFQILFWWMRGRALLKQKLGVRVTVNPADLPYNQTFLAWLHEEKRSGRKLVLATASDLKMAQPISDYVGIFDEVLASNGKTNLRSENKLRVLTEKFGERGFDYAGNSSADYAVWRGSREAVVVNASRAVLRQAADCTKLGPTFCEDFSRFEVLQSFCRELFWRSGYLAAALAGLLLASAFPKWSLAGFAWIAPALLLAAVQGKSSGDRLRAGFLSGFIFWFTSIYWLCYNPYGIFPILGWFALSAYLAFFTLAWVWLVADLHFPASTWVSRQLWILGGAAAWVALEMVRAHFLGGFPWNLLGASQYKLVPLIQIAAVTGIYGVSFLVAWFSLALFCAGKMILADPKRKFVWQAEIVLPLVTVMLCYIGGFFRAEMNVSSAAGRPAPSTFLHVTMVQPSIPQTAIWNSAADDDRFQDFLAQNELALTNRTDVLIWPESAVPAMDYGNVHRISDLVRRHHVWLIFNGEDSTVSSTATNFFNAAYLINPQGQLAAKYHKQKLVMFGEYIPLVHWLPFLQRLDPIGDGWTPGEKSVAFPITGLAASEPSNIIYLGTDKNAAESPVSTAKAGPLICFEDSFATVARQAAQNDLDFFVNLTNDGWFGQSSEQWQHMANAVFRAVENGLPMLRCANNGVTCYIDEYGSVRQIFRDAKGSEYGSGVLSVEIPLRRASQKAQPTFYNRHGDRFGWSCIIIVLAMVFRRGWKIRLQKK
jgi:apolipoprotein N-acyltransferase